MIRLYEQMLRWVYLRLNFKFYYKKNNIYFTNLNGNKNIYKKLI